MYPTSVATHSSVIGTSRSTTGATSTSGAGVAAVRDASPQPVPAAAITPSSSTSNCGRTPRVMDAVPPAPSRLEKREEVRVDLVPVGRAHAVRRIVVDLELGVPDQPGGQHRRSPDRHDLIVFAVKDEGGDVEALQIRRVIGLREHFDALVDGLEASLHALQPERIAQSL